MNDGQTGTKATREPTSPLRLVAKWTAVGVLLGLALLLARLALFGPL